MPAIMNLERRLILFYIVATELLHVNCKYVLEFQFHKYRNENGRLANGRCCDNTWYFGCDTSCDTTFTKLCLYDAGSKSCISGTSHNPGNVGGNNINFRSSIGSLNNPFNYKGNSIPEDGFDLYLKIMDEDTYSNDDLIDEVIVEVTSTLRLVAQSSTVAGEHGRASLTLSYTLQCESNYYGSNCTKYCIPQDDNNGHYTCDNKTGEIVCRDGWQNPDSNCVEVACSVFCSKDGGTCDNHGDCVCNDGWSGGNCGTPICAEDCSGTGGYCNSPGECTCYPTWTGDNCDTELCGKCSNEGGHCQNSTCTCNSGYTGRSCEIDLDPCSHHSPCANSGTCTNDGVGGYNCSCPAGVTGTQCDTDINECLTSPCLNNATCINSIGSYSCLCDNGWAGDHCETDIDDCKDNPCLHEGNCTDLLNGHDCSCTAEYEGLNCELLIDACFPSPCENNSTCTNLVTNYTCRCSPPYLGRNCESLIATSSSMAATGSRDLQPTATVPVHIIRNTSSNTPASTMIALIITTILAVLLMVIVVMLLGVLYYICMYRRRAVGASADKIESSTKNQCYNIYDSKGSNEHNQSCTMGPTINPTCGAPELKEHQLFDDPLYCSIEDVHNNMYTIPNCDSIMKFSKSIDCKETQVHPPRNAPVTSKYKPDITNAIPIVPSNYEEPLSLSRNINAQPIYESIDAPGDNDSAPNPLYWNTLANACGPVGVAPGVNNPMYIESSWSGKCDDTTQDSNKCNNSNTALNQNVNPAYQDMLPREAKNGSKSPH